MPDIMVRNKHGLKKTSFPWCNTPLIPLSPSSTMIPSGERGGRAGQGLDGDGPGGFLRGTTQHVFFVPTKRDKKKEQPPIFIPTDWIWRLNHVPTEPYTLFLIGVVYWSRSSPAG